jgi:hypothetical protein
MKKSINNPADKQEIFSKLDKLTAETKPEWGKMNVNQMLHHVSTAANFAFADKAPEKKATFFNRTIMKWMVFNVTAPKGTKTLDGLDMVALGINPDDFNSERQKVKDVFERITASDKFQLNPFLGELTKEEWGRLCYVHSTHHLKQFGV